MYKKTFSFIKRNKLELLQMCLLCAIVMASNSADAANVGKVGAAGDVQSKLPWKTGLANLTEEVTGPLPQFIGLLSIAGSAGMLMFGEMGPAAKRVMQVVLGVSVALGAFTILGLLTPAEGLCF